MWWHHVEALEPFNVLVNYWWRDTPRYLAQPQDALNHALLAIRDLPEEEKELWRQMFDYYVFGDAAAAAAHSPEGSRGILDAAGRRERRTNPRQPAQKPVAMSAWPCRKIVIAGGGTAGWMAAAAIARTMGKAVDLTLIESELIGTIGVGESTIPPLVTYNRLLGINEADFMRATQATFKLGIGFENWKEVGHRYFHSFGIDRQGPLERGLPAFLAQRARARPRRALRRLLPRAVGRLRRQVRAFARRPDELRLSARFLALCEIPARDGRGRRRGPGRGQDRRGRARRDSGAIAALKLESGQRIEGDLFVDCTGFRALLIDGALKSGFEDWTHWLPCDSAIAIQTRAVRPPVPYTLAMAHDSGWQWRIPLQHRVGNGIVFCSRYLDKDAALERLLGNIEGDTLTEPNVLRFKAGVRRAAVGQELHRGGAFERVHGAAGIDQHPFDPACRAAPDPDASAQRGQRARRRWNSTTRC